MRPLKLLDLCCCAGGAATGYHRAGFSHVAGVDKDPQPRYPYRFLQADALAVLRWIDPDDWDALHGSPPCQRFSDLAHRNRNADAWPDLIEPMRELMIQTGLPYIIENVEGAPLRDPITLCGAMFPELRVYRHRLFESNVPLIPPQHPKHRELTFTHDKRKSHYGRQLDLNTMRVQVTGGGNAPVWAKRKAMGDLDWMSNSEVNEAIPPAYTQFLGEQLIEHLAREAP